MPDKNLSFLFSAAWWKASFELVKGQFKRFLLPAGLAALSNCCSIYSEKLLSGSLNVSSLSPDEVDLGRLLGLAATLIGVSLLGLLAALISLSLWLIELTALSRLAILPKEKFQNCLREIKSNGKYLSGVWFVGTIYLLLPVLVLSIALSLLIISNSNIKLMGEPLLKIPSEYSLPLQIITAIMTLLTLDYSIILTVYSSLIKLKAKLACSLSCEILFKQAAPLSVLNCVLFILDIIISMPFLIFPLFPQLAPLAQDMNFAFIFQSWFALSSAITWPLSILIFAEFLKVPMKDKNFGVELD